MPKSPVDIARDQLLVAWNKLAEEEAEFHKRKGELRAAMKALGVEAVNSTATSIIRMKIEEYMGAYPSFKRDDVVTYVSNNPTDSIKTMVAIALRELVRDGKLKHLGWGRYEVT